MTIQTKFSVGQFVWFMRENRAASDKVVRIHVDVHASTLNPSEVRFEQISYEMDQDVGCGRGVRVDENHCFPTRQALLEAL